MSRKTHATDKGRTHAPPLPLSIRRNIAPQWVNGAWACSSSEDAMALKLANQPVHGPLQSFKIRHPNAPDWAQGVAIKNAVVASLNGMNTDDYHDRPLFGGYSHMGLPCDDYSTRDLIRSLRENVVAPLPVQAFRRESALPVTRQSAYAPLPVQASHVRPEPVRSTTDNSQYEKDLIEATRLSLQVAAPPPPRPEPVRSATDNSQYEKDLIEATRLSIEDTTRPRLMSEEEYLRFNEQLKNAIGGAERFVSHQVTNNDVAVGFISTPLKKSLSSEPMTNQDDLDKALERSLLPYCSKCHEILAKDQKFCGECGVKVHKD
jgi:hypothetical protein